MNWHPARRVSPGLRWLPCRSAELRPVAHDKPVRDKKPLRRQENGVVATRMPYRRNVPASMVVPRNLRQGNQRMGGVTSLLRTNTWAAIGLCTVVTVGLGVVQEWQAAAFLACVLGCFLMWKSEIDNPTIPPPDLDDD
jgi:hypothetical protein